ncbi:MAG: inositol 2-dehydrogenase [Anaerolineae bacterium]|nr:inositol 2-dehydrogenase [Anaerolineae bacterium]MDH7473443.1 inositol 2-dehydrogenase [Anaerolineae bacterium]
MDRVNIGLIGAGRIGRMHAEHLAFRVPGAHLLAVADVFVEAAEKCAASCQIPSAFQDYHRILDNPDIDAVVICSSTDTHAQIIEEAAAASKHIFCEKPIDFDLARIDRALTAVDRAGVKLQIGFNRRFDPSFKRARDLVAEGKIGQPHIVRITSRDPQPPPISYIKVSGGIFLDMTIHDFDMARYLVGDEVTEIFATGAVLVDPEIGKAGDVDTAVITLRYVSGAIGTIDNSRRAVYGYDQRVEVFGSAGAIMVSNNIRDSAVLSDAHGVHGALPLFFFVERYTEAYIAEMRAFVECVQQDKTPPVTGIDGRIPVVMGYAARKSYTENRPVKLSEID